jgi:hypothetical protein
LFFDRRIKMKALRMIMIIAVMLFIVATISGCLEENRGQVNLQEINYSLYGPHETDISME